MSLTLEQRVERLKSAAKLVLGCFTAEYLDRVSCTNCGTRLTDSVELFSEPQELEWAIVSFVDGKETDRIIYGMTEVEAKDWVKCFPDSYKLIYRSIPGIWKRCGWPSTRADVNITGQS